MLRLSHVLVCILPKLDARELLSCSGSTATWQIHLAQKPSAARAQTSIIHHHPETTDQLLCNSICIGKTGPSIESRSQKNKIKWTNAKNTSTRTTEEKYTPLTESSYTCSWSCIISPKQKSHIKFNCKQRQKQLGNVPFLRYNTSST